jgi:hypothetical protein
MRQSGIDFSPAVRVLTIRADEWTQSILDGAGAEMLKVRHPVPACTRIEVTRPAVVVVGTTVQWRDFLLVMAAAASVGARVIELRFSSERSLRRELSEAIDATIAQREREAVLPAVA